MYCYYAVAPDRGVLYRTGETEFNDTNVGGDILINGVLEVPLNLSTKEVYMIGRSMPPPMHESLKRHNSRLPIDPDLSVYFAGPFKVQRENYVFIIVASTMQEAQTMLQEKLSKIAKDFRGEHVVVRTLATRGRFAEILFDQARIDALNAMDVVDSKTNVGAKRKRFRGDAKPSTVYYADKSYDLDTSEQQTKRQRFVE